MICNKQKSRPHIDENHEIGAPLSKILFSNNFPVEPMEKLFLGLNYEKCKDGCSGNTGRRYVDVL